MLLSKDTKEIRETKDAGESSFLPTECSLGAAWEAVCITLLIFNLSGLVAGEKSIANSRNSFGQIR